MSRRNNIPWATLEERAGTTDIEEIARKLGMKVMSVARQKGRKVVPAGWLVRLAHGASGQSADDELPEAPPPAAGSEITFQAGFRFPGMDPTAIVRDGKLENVKAFLEWCRDIAAMAERAARSPATPIAAATGPPRTADSEN